ncbi:hypothetical protein [Nocardioides sp. CFH 31398]|uniref:hypothetical protein n=1 Tax=Nocardioides sp. CFH 31398 TaxID=2919579 RepID=UPI001F0666DD|nr:hypothetical protein [Nocardioides sp. CFH 31398]MCH1865121.1 hypothetical protein [Nocardioides sp. CFH 31398]
MSRAVMEKVLWPEVSRSFGERGDSHVGGAVVGAADAASLGGPAGRVAAHGLADLWPQGPEPWSVDVLRYAAAPLMRHRTPAADTPSRPWPTYPHGFLPATGAIVPVWDLATTRVPVGAEVWRVHAGGAEQHLLTYDGPAYGWRGAMAWAPTLGLVGPRAQWQGREWIAAHAADPSWVQLVAYGDPPDATFDSPRPGVVTRTVPLAECARVFALDLRGRWAGFDVRLLHTSGGPGGSARVELVDPDPEQAATVGATAVEPGRFEITVRADQVEAGESHVLESDA